MCWLCFAHGLHIASLMFTERKETSNDFSVEQFKYDMIIYFNNDIKQYPGNNTKKVRNKINKKVEYKYILFQTKLSICNYAVKLGRTAIALCLRC